jgi:predicted NBD/HSP70 family sugar kinase
MDKVGRDRDPARRDRDLRPLTAGRPLTTGRLAKATLRETREHNERLVLATIYDDGPVSRAEVARLTGLTRTTVSDVVDGLLTANLVHEMGRGASTGGKAPILLAVPDVARVLVGVDLGDQVFSAATVNLRGEIIDRLELPSEDADGEAGVELALRLIEQVLALAGPNVVGIGIGAPGLVDTTDGTVIEAVKRRWRELPLGRRVAEKFGLPVYVANDSQAAALAEHVYGSVRPSNLIVIKVGQGIGAGLVLHNELFQGDGFGAGEIGHFVIDPAGEACRCGRRGCLETVASTRAVLQHLGELAGRPVSIDEAVSAFNAGDGATNAVVLDAGERLGQAVGALIGALNVRRIVLAGSMAAFGGPWLAAVREAAGASALAALTEDTTLELGGIEDIVVLGASALLMTRELGLTLRPVHPVRRLRSLEAGSTEALDRARDVAGIVPAELVVQRGGRGG